MSKAANHLTEQLYCVLIAVGDDTLLLPNAVIAETMGQDALKSGAAEPRWLAGEVTWGERNLSVLRFESLNGAAHAALNKRARVVVLQTLDTDAGQAPLALVAQGYPHLITVTRRALANLPLRDSDDASVVLARVRVGNTEAVIPDLDALRLRLNGLTA